MSFSRDIQSVTIWAIFYIPNQTNQTYFTSGTIDVAFNVRNGLLMYKFGRRRGKLYSPVSEHLNNNNRSSVILCQPHFRELPWIIPLEP